jgi:hypothetical protein
MGSYIVNMSYPVDMQIQYGTNEEYRVCFRQLCKMRPMILDMSLVELDEETMDEQDFDMEAASKTVDLIWEQTKSHVLFAKLYEKAAAIMISEDREIGLAIMVSYDYLDVFHPCFCEFMRDPVFFSETNVFYLAVLERFKKLGYDKSK